MNFLQGIGNWLGNLFEGNQDDPRKRQQQAQLQPATPAPQAAPSVQPQQQRPQDDELTKAIKLFLPGYTPPQKQGPASAPAAAIGAQLGYGPNASTQPAALVKANPVPRQPIEVPQVNMPLETAKQAVLGVGHTIADPAIKNFNQMQADNQKAYDSSGPGLGGAAKATLAQTGNFIKAIGATGAEYAPYFAPEIKGLSAAPEASALVKAGTGLLAHGATSAPLSVASDLASGEHDPLTIAQHAGAASLVAGATGHLMGLRKAQGEPGVPTNQNGLVPTTPEVAPGVRSINPNQSADATSAAAQQAAADAEKARQAMLDEPTFKRQGKDAPAPQGPLDVPTFQRNGADKAIKDAQERIDTIDTMLQKVKPYNQATREANRLELAAAMARDPREGATVLRKQLLRKASGYDPEGAIAGLAPAREAAVNDLIQAKAAQEARDALAKSPGAGEAAPSPQISDASPTTPEQTPAPATESGPTQTSPQPTAPQPGGTGIPMPSAELSPAEMTAASSSPGSVAQTSNDVNAATATAAPPPPPELPGASGPAVPAAPLTHDALVKQLGSSAAPLKGQYSERAALNIADTKQRAAAAIANQSDEDLLKSFATTGPETMVHNTNSMAIARAALDRLAKLPDNPQAVQTVANILDAIDRHVSKSGESLRFAQEAFDSMPLPMKVRYLVKKIDAANLGTKDYAPLAEDPAKAAVVEATITGHLQASQAVAEQAAAVEGQLQHIAETVKQGGPTPADPRPLAAKLKQLQQQLAANNGELVKYYGGLVPGRSTAQKLAVDLPKRLMLSSLSGRVNDLVTTGSNVASLGGQNLIQSAIAKVVNAVKPGTVTDTSLGASKLFTGAASDLNKLGGEVKGNVYAPDMAATLKKNTDLRTGLQKSEGLTSRIIHGAVELPTALTGGVRDQRIYQLSTQEGQKAGLRGQALKDYAEARAATPTPEMRDRADQLHMEVNNLNDNPITHMLNRVGGAIDDGNAFGGFLKNQVVPFTSWLGGNIWNSVTDKNVVAAFVKAANSLRKGDTEGIVQGIAKLGNQSAQFGVGYLLAQSGLVTNQNAEGYNDAGAYLHIGDRYIPVAVLGHIAPNIILGSSAYQGVNGDGSPAHNIASAAGSALANFAKSINAAGAVGVNSNLSQSAQMLAQKGDAAANAADAAATFAAGAAGQYIPALLGDANAVINNSSLNPTHEKADTKVADPNSKSGTAKDVVKSVGMGLLNKIPGISQMLPRKQDVAAPDLLDRVTKGDRGTAGGEAAQAQAKNEADRTKDFKSRDIPDPKGKNFDDAVQARVESGEYDKAIEGLKAKLGDQQSNKDIPASKNQTIKDEITKLTVTKKGNYDPKVIDLYKKTSLTEWRDMGDPTSDAYDQKTYDLLWKYDSELAKAGVSRNNTIASDNFYSPKAPPKGRGSSADSTAKSNTIGNTPSLGKVSLGDLAPQKAGSVKIPTIQQVKAGDLVKKRQISVRKA